MNLQGETPRKRCWTRSLATPQGALAQPLILLIGKEILLLSHKRKSQKICEGMDQDEAP